MELNRLSRLTSAIAENPAPYLIGAAGVAFLIGYMRGNQTISRNIKGLFLQLILRRVMARYI